MCTRESPEGLVKKAHGDNRAYSSVRQRARAVLLAGRKVVSQECACEKPEHTSYHRRWLGQP